ncbi:MFS transporter [Companilactobacillus metriopterae]|uniref:MFS transporter n=1 Tax=Companilactobacillus metriopterae TaxID=1909267 RepID=UPI00100AE1E5|nr:MFS transporter [Companilactobacillus metriopterae]
MKDFTNKNVTLPLTLNLIITFGNFFSLPFLTLLLQHRGMKLTLIGIILGIPSFISFIASPLISYLLNRYSPKLIMFISFFLIIVGFSGYTLLQSFYGLALSACLVGLGFCIYNPIYQTLLSSLPGKQSDRAMMTSYWLANLAGAIGPLVGSLIGGGKSSKPFILYIVLLFIALIPVSLIDYTIIKVDKDNKNILKNTFWSVLKNHTFLLLASIYLLYFIIETQYDSSFAIHLQAISNNGARYLSYMMLSLTVSVLLSQLIVMTFAKYEKYKLEIFIGLVLYLLAIIGFILIKNVLILSIVVGSLLGVGESMIGPRIQILIGKSVSPEQKSTAFTLNNGFGNIGYSLGPSLGLSLIAFNFNLYGIILFGLIILIGFIFFLFFKSQPLSAEKES